MNVIQSFQNISTKRLANVDNALSFNICYQSNKRHHKDKDLDVGHNCNRDQKPLQEIQSHSI